MEYSRLKGLFSRTFWNHFNKKNKLPTENKVIGCIHAKFLFMQLLQGLEYSKTLYNPFNLSVVHGMKIAHRDLKPQNILVNQNMTLKICDFGISKDYSQAENDLESCNIGTIAFHAPEVYKRSKLIISNTVRLN